MDKTQTYALLREGSQILLRPYGVADRPEIERLFSRLTPENLMFRFHSGGLRLDRHAIDLVTSGHVLVGELSGRIVALASFVELRDPSRAEMAITVDDTLHGRGIGTALFERLAGDAWRTGIRRFVAYVLRANHGMLELLQGLGFHLSRESDEEEFEFEVELRPDAHYLESADARAHVAASASLVPLFRPRAVAVVGASRRADSIGHAIFRNLLRGGYDGPIYPIHPTAAAVASVRAYPSAKALPEPIDMAIIAVPARAVLEAARGCLDAGARALVVITAGFAETGGDGPRRQQELVTMCRERGARLVGPNCLGILINGPLGLLNGTFAPNPAPAGGVAVASQSGALGIAILEEATRLGLGVSAFVSMGNKADVSSNDLIEWWDDDPATRVIVLYLESFGNPRRFARLARRVGRRTPIVVVKGGRSESGRRAAASHTAALASSEVGVDALFRQAGVIRCDTLQELFEVTALLAHQPLPAGRRVGVVTNAGGLGILCADACESRGLLLPPLGEATREALRSLLPPEASVSNPVDMLASANAEGYGKVLELVLADPAVDAAIVLFVPPLITQATDVALALTAACDPPPKKPVLACFVGAQGLPPACAGRPRSPPTRFRSRRRGHSAMPPTTVPGCAVPPATNLPSPTSTARAPARSSRGGSRPSPHRRHGSHPTRCSACCARTGSRRRRGASCGPRPRQPRPSGRWGCRSPSSWCPEPCSTRPTSGASSWTSRRPKPPPLPTTRSSRRSRPTATRTQWTGP